MKKTVHALSAFALLATAPLQAQTFDITQVKYWVGSGPDSSVLVIDFQDGTDDPSYAWGFLHDGTATGEDMVNAVAAADPNITADIPGGFLNSFTYGDHAGIGGSPDYWSTWSGTSVANMEMNMGLAELLFNGSWFGCSYTDFDPALNPREPIAAFDPLAFTADDVQFWVGSGSNSAILVIDFQDGSATPSYAWGFRFDGSTTGEAMLNAVRAADASLDAVVTSGFLSDLTYGTQEGIGGAPDYWSTWSATNLGNWTSNLGLSTAVNDGGLFGCSYTDFMPAIRPTPPVAAGPSTGLVAHARENMLVYPQPAEREMNIRSEGSMDERISIVDLAGQLVYAGRTAGMLTTVDVSTWAAGLYVLQVGAVKRTIAVQ
ncbi:MAG TPA: T9SS type A sorting domain-containing protein [Flavobacteriales bacterium]|nr:T9SS type A sorting domain-containing protein [Flavobacteriales bacterium]